MVSGFKAFDTDNSGKMDKKEFKQLLISLGLRDITDDQVADVIAQVDTNSDGEISWDEFVDMYGLWHKSGKSAA